MKEMQNTGLYTKLIVIALLIGTLTIAPALSPLTDTTVIRSVGTMGYASEVTAKSGYWKDIQIAVDQVVAAGGTGNVYIPAGTFNFVNVGEAWTGARVVIPAGVNLFGAPTERTTGLPYDGIGQNPNDQVVEWKTVLRLPWDVPGPLDAVPAWFKIVANGDSNKHSRFSDIKLVGYRSIDPESTQTHTAISVETVVDFRIDHCYFEHTTAGISARSEYQKPTTFRGVIDHCYLVNTYGSPTPYPSNIGYGVHAHIDWHYKVWDSIDAVLGHYNDYTVFVEDCYFEKWRHCICTNNGGHIVFRHNTVQYDFGYGTLDQHELRTETSGRALEIYNNQLLAPVEGWGKTAINWRGGGGVAFNNTVTGYNKFVYLADDYAQGIYFPHDIWIWNNNLNGATDIGIYSTVNNLQENVHYFRRTPTQTQDGFAYNPYPYPHPLTLKP